MAKKTCININFDSITSWLPLENKPIMLEDPAFYWSDRFFYISQKYDFKYTIFVNGIDLEHSLAREKVSQWSKEGHEIANHSYSHKLNLGSLSVDDIEDELMRSHEIISKVTGKEPRGFVAPGWSFSTNLMKILKKNGYLYDTSVFPSYFMWAASIKLWLKARENSRRRIILDRKDRLFNLFARRKPFMIEGMLTIPLPVTPFARIPCWHTMAMLLPQPVFGKVLNSCLKLDYFYYLLHPVDLMEQKDIPNDFGSSDPIERIDITLPEKIELLQRNLEKIIKKSAQITTLECIAKEILDENSYIF